MKEIFLIIFSFISALFPEEKKTLSLPISLPPMEQKALSSFQMLITFDREKIEIGEKDIIVNENINLNMITVENGKIKLLGIVKELKVNEPTEIVTLNFTARKKGKTSFNIKSLQVFCQPENCSATSEKKTSEETIAI